MVNLTDFLPRRNADQAILIGAIDSAADDGLKGIVSILEEKTIGQVKSTAWTGYCEVVNDFTRLKDGTQNLGITVMNLDKPYCPTWLGNICDRTQARPR